MFPNWLTYATAQDELYWAYDRARRSTSDESAQGAMQDAYFALMGHLESFYHTLSAYKRLTDEDLQRLQKCLVLPKGGSE